MKKLSLALLAALLIAPSLVKADPVNENSTVTNTPAANGGTENRSINNAQSSKSDSSKAMKKHKKHKKKMETTK